MRGSSVCEGAPGGERGVPKLPLVPGWRSEPVREEGSLRKASPSAKEHQEGSGVCQSLERLEVRASEKERERESKTDALRVVMRILWISSRTRLLRWLKAGKRRSQSTCGWTHHSISFRIRSSAFSRTPSFESPTKPTKKNETIKKQSK